MSLSAEVVTHMAQQHHWGWTAGQIARYHGIERSVVEETIGAGFPLNQPPVCPACGVEFVPRNPGAVYCSAQCQRREQNRRRTARKRAAAEPVRCATCGTPFQPIGAQRYCSGRCRPQSQRIAAEATKARERKATQRATSAGARETAAIVPSERKPARTTPMTDEEFDIEYQREVRKLIDAGRPVIDPAFRLRTLQTSLGHRDRGKPAEAA